ncbi:MAG TPA: ACT domain-containing protein [Thermoanaerobaculia bacterium]
MHLGLEVLPCQLAVCRLPAESAIPSWVSGTFTSITRTPEEVSIVCDQQCVPHDVQASRGWRLLKVSGPIAFETTGVAAALIQPLADANISVFLIATYDTDYLLLQESSFNRALDRLRDAGHSVTF